MNKKIISGVAAILALFALVSCTPAADIIPTGTDDPTGIIIPDSGNIDTEFKNYVICSQNFVFYSGEYNYFFIKIVSEATKDGSDYDIDLNKSLKEQYAGSSDKTWFEVFRDLTVDYMKELLYVYEAAMKADEKYSKAADDYIYEYVVPKLKEESGGDPVEYVFKRFDGAVQYQNYLNALAVEYIYELYTETEVDKIKTELSAEAVKEYADSLEGEKDTEKVRNIISVNVSKGKNAAEELRDSFVSGGNMTADALSKLAEGKGYTYYYETLLPDGEGAIYDWTFSKERAAGDVGVTEISGEGYYVIFYIGEGEEVYLLKARLALARESFDAKTKSAIGAYGHFKTDENKLNDINA